MQKNAFDASDLEADRPALRERRENPQDPYRARHQHGATVELPRFGKSTWERRPDEVVAWWKSSVFLGFHVLAMIAPFLVGVTWNDVILCFTLYYIRMFAITGGYHRYFSHRAYKTGRVFQFLLALLGTTCGQKGPLWWAANHRHHHRYSDTEHDIHSPARRGFWWSHIGWILCTRYEQTDWERIQDYASYPELRWLNRYHLIPPFAVLGLLYILGGWHAAVWGGMVSTMLLWHGTFTINSLSHVFGSRRYPTKDTSRNNGLLALITMGEGWHNNHHYYPSSVRQGFFWWEVDFSYYILRALAAVGIVWDLRLPPESLLRRR